MGLKFYNSSGRSIHFDLKSERLYGRSGVGFHQFSFHVRVKTPATHEAQQIICKSFSAEISVSNNKSDKNTHYLGIASAVPTDRIETYSDDGEGCVILNLDISGQQLEALEKIRNGGELSFSGRLRAEMFMPSEGKVSYGTDHIRFSPNQKEWIDNLKRVGYSEIALFEIPTFVPDELPGWKIPLELLNKAREHHLEGEYKDCIATCREILEFVSKTRGEEGQLQVVNKAYRGNQDARKAMNKGDRELAFRSAIQHFTNLAHHVKDDLTTTVFTRHDSMLILSMTAAFLSKYSYEKLVP